MKVNVEVDATPEELRRFFGLPDIQPLHEEMIEMIRQRMHEGAEGYDPMTIMAPLMSSQFQNMETMQKVFWDTFSGASRRRPTDDSDDQD